MRICNRNFSPGLWPSLATIVILPVLVALGVWQLDRADQKRFRYEMLIKRQSEEAININQSPALVHNENEMLGRKLIATGHFNENIQILLDNQVMKNQAGYFVFTPFNPAGQDVWFLVNRGWVATGGDRNKLPGFIGTANDVLISGTAMTVPATGIRIGKITDEQLAPGIYRLQSIDLSHISKLIGAALMPYIIRLDTGSQYGYARMWEKPDSGENVHLAYAFQWFLLAVTLLLIYIIVNLEKVQDPENR